MSITLTTPPLIEPIGLEQARDHVRADDTMNEAEIDLMIKDARQTVENWTGRALLTQTIDIRLDAFPNQIETDAVLQGGVGTILLPRPPLQSVTSITYTDTTGTPIVLATDQYDVDSFSEPGRIRPGFGLTWPNTRDVDNAVTIRAIVGHGDGVADIPAPLISAILLTLTDRFDHRGTLIIGTISSELDQTLQSLLWDYRILPLTHGVL